MPDGLGPEPNPASIFNTRFNIIFSLNRISTDCLISSEQSDCIYLQSECRIDFLKMFSYIFIANYFKDLGEILYDVNNGNLTAYFFLYCEEKGGRHYFSKLMICRQFSPIDLFYSNKETNVIKYSLIKEDENASFSCLLVLRELFSWKEKKTGLWDWASLTCVTLVRWPLSWCVSPLAL